jgi:hypothetical protein
MTDHSSFPRQTCSGTLNHLAGDRWRNLASGYNAKFQCSLMTFWPKLRRVSLDVSRKPARS